MFLALSLPNYLLHMISLKCKMYGVYLLENNKWLNLVANATDIKFTWNIWWYDQHSNVYENIWFRDFFCLY